MNVVERATASLGAGASATPFSGRPINFAQFNAYLEIGVGGGAGLTYDLTINGAAVATGVPCQTLTAYPTLPGQLELQDEKVWAGSNISLRINNPTAGALTYYCYGRLSDEKRGT